MPLRALQSYVFDKILLKAYVLVVLAYPTLCITTQRGYLPNLLT